MEIQKLQDYLNKKSMIKRIYIYIYLYLYVHIDCYIKSPPYTYLLIETKQKKNMRKSYLDLFCLVKQ